MSIDPGLQAFVQESRDLLEEAEDTLLKLEGNPTDADLVNALFRAVHTIKGAAGLFGFDAVVGFTHHAESVMGLVREGILALDEQLLTIFLESRDHIAALVEHALQEDQSLDAPIRAEDERLTAQLQRYLETSNEAPVSASAGTPALDTDAATNPDSDAQVVSDKWHLSLRFGQDALRNGMDPLSFLRYLNTVGDIVNLSPLYDDLPVVAEMDPESCYLGFEVDLKSEASKSDIEQVFEFVQDDSVIRILPPHSRLADYVKLIDELPEENLRLGEILTLSGALTRHELDEALRAQEAEPSGVATEPEAPEPVTPRLGEVLVSQGVVETPVVDAALKKQKKAQEAKSLDNQVIRVNAGKLEELINLVGELVIASAHSQVRAQQAEDAVLIEAAEGMSRLVEDIRDTALGLRMVQIGDTFNRFRRVVRELSRELGKDIELEINGGETELDKTVVEKIGDPLMHLVRNAIDHGVESPGERRENGKTVRASLSLNAYHDSGSIVIEVVDDGRGLSQERILAKAIERDLIKPNQALTEREIYRLIFEPGFSTAEQVTNVSGRGVGMDVVRRNIDALRGTIDVESTPGSGSRFTIRLPLTLAIIDGFQVRVGHSSYVVPLDLVDECVELDQAIYDESQGNNYVNLRGEVLPFVRLDELFGTSNGALLKSDGKHRNSIVVVQFGCERAGLMVDELLGEYQTVIKPLGKVFQNLKGISGATILGSGEVAMIVDVPDLIKCATTAEGQGVRRAATDQGSARLH